MQDSLIHIIPIKEKKYYKKEPSTYSVLYLDEGIQQLKVNGESFHDVEQSIFFLQPGLHWELKKESADTTAGYILNLSVESLDNPILRKLHINEVRMSSLDLIPKINLAPGIEKRTKAILEMLDELSSSHLNNREDAILSLLNTFFVYCDGQCNIKSVLTENNAKKHLLYRFKKLLDRHFSVYHKVSDYAKILNVSEKYLNECSKEISGMNALAHITEQRIRHSRHALKFTDKSIKEICYELGFSSPEYFSNFLKKQTGLSPSQIRRQ